MCSMRQIHGKPGCGCGAQHPYTAPMAQANTSREDIDWVQLTARIKGWGSELGFQQIGIAGVELAQDEARLQEWLALGWHGDMAWMERHGVRRARPAELIPGTVRIISARMDYLTDAVDMQEVLDNGALAYVSRYALGRDYHTVLRRRLQSLADRIAVEIGPFGYRAFTDSAPVMEKPLARNAGLGWIGKHTNLINTQAGSWFFIGELYADLPLIADAPATDHCGTCTRCIQVCPTGAIVAPYRLDARQCISYLTIEHEGAIPEPLRKLLGNRIYGCDDCQLVCPWNKFARLAGEADFRERHGLASSSLVELFAWSEEEFLRRCEGSAIRRIGHQRWLRNIAVALGNAPQSVLALDALRARADHPSALVREHVAWAIARQQRSAGQA